MTLALLRNAFDQDRPTVVLVVAMADSVHTLRWLRAACCDEMRFVLMPAAPNTVQNPGMFVLVSDPAHVDRMQSDDIGLWSPHSNETADDPDSLPPPLEFENRSGFFRGATVARAIRALKPQLVHSMELQMAGYTCLTAARQMGADFPLWLISNWGSDLYLYSKLKEHRPVLCELMRKANGYISECRRDISIARQLGFCGAVLAPLPASAGMNLSKTYNSIPPSKRTEIIIKGYHGWSGRGLQILSATHLAASSLRGFRIRIRHGSPPIEAMADALRVQDGLDIALEPHVAAHETSLERLGEARISISMGISGGIDTTMLESMSLGTFPIVSSACCASEWIESGRDGYIINPHDTAGLARALTNAVSDDELVDRAAVRNRAEVGRRWNAATNKDVIRRHYRAVIASARGPAESQQRSEDGQH